eukprot:symbB.v1.2.032351.t1/scaffold3867.1/size49036/3
MDVDFARCKQVMLEQEFDTLTFQDGFCQMQRCINGPAAIKLSLTADWVGGPAVFSQHCSEILYANMPENHTFLGGSGLIIPKEAGHDVPQCHPEDTSEVCRRERHGWMMILELTNTKRLGMSEMIQIHVALPNGHAELFTLLPSSTVQDLRTKAQRAFGKKYLGLVTAKNRVLVDFEQTLEEAEIKDGECLTALVLKPQLAATASAFALWCHGDSRVVTWGDAECGGDSSAVRDQLRGVQQIQATSEAFAAILEDGSVVTWGDEYRGGDSSGVRDQLKGVQQIQASHYAFAAILEDGLVVTWGALSFGGD